MVTPDLPEVWLRGPIEGVPALLQPVAHALLQAREEVIQNMASFPEELLWKKPAGMASAAFHLRHMAGVADRLFSYARGQMLTDGQLAALELEKLPHTGLGAQALIGEFSRQVDQSIEQLKNTDEKTLLESRAVGRKRLSSTVIGLLFHTAEHVQRHMGQLLVTINVIEKNHQPGL